MSSQGFNATDYSGFIQTSNTGSPGGFPLRDAQDYTLLRKRVGVYHAINNDSPVQLPSQFYPVIQSNTNRLSSQFGEVGCEDCDFRFSSAPVIGVRRG